MALDARHRSSIYGKFAEILGEDDANALMTEFPSSIEADELVTKQFLRAEMAELRADMAGLRADVSDRLRQQTVWGVTALAATNAVVLAAMSILA